MLADGLHRVPVARLMRSPEFPALFAEYARESRYVELAMPPTPSLEIYSRLEVAGMLTVFAWARTGRIVGYCKLLVSVIPHYGLPMGVVESLFVASAHRKGGAGLALMRAAEAHAGQQGCPIIMASAPVGGRLAEVLPRRGYREANRVFVKRVAACPT